MKAKIEDIYIENIYSFLAWAVCHKRPEELNEKECRTTRKLLNSLLERYPSLRELKPGFNPAVKHTTFSLDRIPYLHRPLLLYVITGLGEVFFNILFLRLHGFQSLELHGVTYWIKQGRVSNSLPPLVFFHGIAPGWSFYALLLKQFERSGRTILLIDLEAIKVKSMRFYMPPIEVFTSAVLHILRRHQIAKASFVGHSFGTILAGWIATRHPEVVSHLTLLDPVSLLLSLPDVAYNFVHRPPTSLMEWMLYLAAAQEITISYTLYRNFCWHKNILWLEDLPSHIGVVVGIGSNDEIANGQAIEEYVLLCQRKRRQGEGDNEEDKKQTLPKADIHFLGWKNFSHGQVLASLSALTEVHQVVTVNEKQIQWF